MFIVNSFVKDIEHIVAQSLYLPHYNERSMGVHPSFLTALLPPSRIHSPYGEFSFTIDGTLALDCTAVIREIEEILLHP